MQILFIKDCIILHPELLLGCRISTLFKAFVLNLHSSAYYNMHSAKIEHILVHSMHILVRKTSWLCQSLHFHEILFFTGPITIKESQLIG